MTKGQARTPRAKSFRNGVKRKVKRMPGAKVFRGSTKAKRGKPETKSREELLAPPRGRGRPKGVKQTEEAKRKIGEHWKGTKQSEGHKSARAAGNRGSALAKKLKGQVKAGNIRKNK